MADLTYPSLLKDRIVTMAAAPPNDLVTTVCDNVLSLTASQRDAIMKNGWNFLDDFQGLNYDRIKTWARESNRLLESRGGCYFVSVAMAKLQGLTYWANHMILRGHTLVCDGFDYEMMRQLMDGADIHYAESKRDSDAQIPTKFKYDEWIEWQQSVITYLTSKKSVTPSASIYLYYVICTKPCPIVDPDKSPSDEIIYNASHTGREFETDNK